MLFRSLPPSLPTAIVPGKDCRITIFKGSQVLGLTIVGGVDTYLHSIIIERVIPDSPAAKDGRLHPGDRILEVNDVSLSEATCDDALAALQLPSPFIHLTVRRDHARETLPEGEKLYPPFLSPLASSNPSPSLAPLLSPFLLSSLSLPLSLPLSSPYIHKSLLPPPPLPFQKPLHLTSNKLSW